MHLMYSTVYSTVYCTLKCIVQCTLYTILYKDATSGIDKYTVYLTEHASLNLPLKCEYNMMYSKMYTVSLIATNLCLMYIVLNTLQ